MKAISTRQTARETVESLVRRHQSSVRGFLVFLGCPGPMVDDLVQDVFLTLLSSPFEERGEASTASFLRTVARNLFLKAMRREQRQPLIADLVGAERAWLEYEGEDGGRGYLAALRECLQHLKGKAREILALRYEVSLAQAVIADRLGMSESGVKSVLVRSRKRLRDCVERRLESPESPPAS